MTKENKTQALKRLKKDRRSDGRDARRDSLFLNKPLRMLRLYVPVSKEVNKSLYHGFIASQKIEIFG